MKNKLYIMSKGKQQEQAFYLKDKSTCCKINISTILKGSSGLTSDGLCKPMESGFLPRASSLSSHLPIHSNRFVSTEIPSHKQSLVIEERSPNHFFVQSSEGGPFVTVNTGTQYIHNIYPESNFTVVQPSTMQGCLPGTFSSTQTMVSLPTTQSVNQVSRPPQIFVDSLDLQDINSCNESRTRQISYNPQYPTDIVTEMVVENSVDSFPEDDCTEDPLNPSTESTFETKYNVTDSIKSSKVLIISDNESKDTVIPSIKITSSVIEIEHNKIKNKPMPKSKKQSLLRSFSLEKQRLDSTKNKLDNDSILTGCDAYSDALAQIEAIDNLSLAQESKCTEPPDEHLLDVRINSNERDLPYETTGKTEPILNIAVQNVDLDNSVTNNIPRIKVKTLEELQDQIDLNTSLTHKNVTALEAEKEQEAKISACQIKEVDVTSLKQGIIDASRTLVTTQKTFKELARTISSQILYETKAAKKMVKKFQDILKICKNQIEEVDRNIFKEYNHLFQNMDMLLKSIQQENEENDRNQRKGVKSALASRKQCKLSTYGIHESPKEGNGNKAPVKGNGSNFKKTLKRKREKVDINPLGKKTILGTPVVTQADVDQIYNQNLTVVSDPCDVFINELKYKQLQLRKKKEIWSYKKKTKWYRKKKTYSSNYKNKLGQRRRKFEDGDGYDEEYPSTSYYKVPNSQMIKCRTRLKPPSKPLRVSQRNHPSTACLGLTPSSFKSQYPTIKPCSVMLHRLDPRIVQLLEMRFQEV